jgi:hypothetical protein
MSVRVGDRCRVAAPLRPTGVVEAGGHRRDARVMVGTIDAGGDAVVVGWDAFGLLVRPAAAVPEPARLPGYGEPVPTVHQQAVEREEAARRTKAEETEEAAHEAREIAGLVGLLAVAAGAIGYWLVGFEGAAIGAGVVLAGLVAVGLHSAAGAGG